MVELPTETIQNRNTQRATLFSLVIRNTMVTNLLKHLAMIIKDDDAKVMLLPFSNINNTFCWSATIYKIPLNHDGGESITWGQCLHGVKSGLVWNT
jgi:hypothetical protein